MARMFGGSQQLIKRILHLRSNSFRIFLDESEVGKVYQTHIQPSIIPRMNVIGQPIIETRDRYSNLCESSAASSTHTRILAGDVRNMLIPVTDVRTKGVDPDGGRWWIHQRPPYQFDVVRSTPRSLETTSRTDFQYRGAGIPGTTRYMANHNRTPAHGAIPASWLRRRDGCQRFLAEDISYEHLYNSRLDPNYPPRGNRHGSFVWHVLPDGQVDQILCRATDDDDAMAPCQITCKHLCPPAPMPSHNEAPPDSNAYHAMTAYGKLIWPDGARRRTAKCKAKTAKIENCKTNYKRHLSPNATSIFGKL